MYSNNASVISTNIHTSVQYKGGELHGIISAKKDSKLLAHRDAGTTGAAGASAPLAFCIFNFVGADYGCNGCTKLLQQTELNVVRGCVWGCFTPQSSGIRQNC